MASLAAVDLGAQSGRVALGSFDGSRLEVREVHRFDNEPIERDGALRWDVEQLRREVVAGLRAAARDTAIDSVAVDSWAIDFGLVDEQGRLLELPTHYRDARRARAVPAVLGRVPARELYDRTGIQLLPINTIFELAGMTLDADPALAGADALLLIPDLFHFWLCGSRTSELTNATTTQCFDPEQGGWAIDLLERLGVPTHVLPEVVPPGTRLGQVSAGVADETGLGSAAVIAAATHDTGSAVVAVPFRAPDAVFLSVGTWSLVGMEVDQPVITDESFAANLTNEGGVAGTYRLLRNVTGLWLLHECRRTWASEGHDLGFDELVALGAEAPPFGSLVDPNAGAFLEPGDLPARIRAYCRETGQAEPESIGATVRCILESLALKHAATVAVLGTVTGTSPAELHIVGGGARNRLLCEWTASAAGLPVLAGPEEATLAGNLLVQAMALGEIGSLHEARDVVRASFEPAVYEPHDSSAWHEARERFVELSDPAGLALGA
jgi:rhamnulokinase